MKCYRGIFKDFSEETVFGFEVKTAVVGFKEHENCAPGRKGFSKIEKNRSEIDKNWYKTRKKQSQMRKNMSLFSTFLTGMARIIDKKSNKTEDTRQ